MKNLDVRAAISQSRFRHYEVSAAIGISEYTLSIWLRTELPQEKKLRILNAVEKLKVGTAQGVQQC